MDEYNKNIDPVEYQAYLKAQQQQDSSFLQFQLDSDKELEKMYYDLLGYTEDNNGNYVIDDNKIKQINEQGANALLTYIRPRITKIFSLSNLEDTDVNIRCLSFLNGMTFFICRHYYEFEICSMAAANNMIDLFDDLYYATLSKSIKGWEGDSVRKTHTTNETRAININDKNNNELKYNSLWER